MRCPPPLVNERCCGAQPARAVTEPLSSSAFRKTCETVGLTSPAQESQASAAISPIAPWTRRVIVSPPSFIAAARSADFDNGFNLDREAARQAAHADRRARMAPDIAEQFDHQVGGAVDYLRHVGELRRAVDKPAEPQNAADPVEIATAGDAQLRED